MRLLSIGIFLLLATQLFSQQVPRSFHDYGKVKQWNNPIFEVSYTNTSGKQQLFLPIAYQNDVLVKFGKEKLGPGESTTVSIQYFTEDFGRFNKEIDVYVSTQNSPITFTISGNIQSFHPDAFTICPRIDNSKLVDNPQFIHSIRVIDAETLEPVSDFEIVLKTKYSKEAFISDQATLSLKREKPDFYQIEIDHENYKLAKTELYIARNTEETVIKLIRIVEVPNSEEFDFSSNSIDETSEIELEEEETMLPQVPNNEIVVIDEPVETIISPPIVSVEDSLDFTKEGTLNDVKYAYNHLVFLIDISGSMKHEDKLPLLKYSMYQMISVLRPEDKVTIITYSTKAKIVIDGMSGANKNALNEAVRALRAQGQSYGKEGLDMAYAIAVSNFIANGNNEIILASDGVFNSKGLNENKLMRNVSKKAKEEEVRLSCVGFGKSKLALSFMERLANKGNGSFIKIKTEKQAETVLVENIMEHSLKK